MVTDAGCPGLLSKTPQSPAPAPAQPLLLQRMFVRSAHVHSVRPSCAHANLAPKAVAGEGKRSMNNAHLEDQAHQLLCMQLGCSGPAEAECGGSVPRRRGTGVLTLTGGVWCRRSTARGTQLFLGPGPPHVASLPRSGPGPARLCSRQLEGGWGKIRHRAFLSHTPPRALQSPKLGLTAASSWKGGWEKRSLLWATLCPAKNQGAVTR